MRGKNQAYALVHGKKLPYFTLRIEKKSPHALTFPNASVRRKVHSLAVQIGALRREGFISKKQSENVLAYIHNYRVQTFGMPPPMWALKKIFPNLDRSWRGNKYIKSPKRHKISKDQK